MHRGGDAADGRARAEDGSPAAGVRAGVFREVSPAARVLLGTVPARTDPDPSGDAPPPGLQQDGAVDWERLYRLAVRERAGAVLWQRRGRWIDGAAPGEWADRLRTLASVTEFRQDRLQRRLEETVGALARADVPVWLLKGAALSRTVYPGPEERPMSDLDLLVPPGRAREARRLCRDTGWSAAPGRFDPRDYRDHPHLPPLVDDGDPELELELHTGLFARGQVPAFSPAELTAADRPLPIGRGRALVPGPTEHLQYVCLHFAWSHMMARGAWRTFRDVEALTRAEAFHPERFLSVSRDVGSGACCYWTLRMARSLGGVDVPVELFEGLRPGLPRPLLDRLERHFAREQVALRGRCPSRTLRRALWSVGLMPRSLGLGSAPPWSHDERFDRDTAESDDDLAATTARRIRQAAGLLRYCWGTIGPGAAGARAG